MYKISDDKRNNIKKLYENGIGTTSIERQLGVSRTSIVKILREYGIWEKGVRPWKHSHNIKFFKTYTKESCYWAGFILADGNIGSKRKCLRICLKDSDDGHLKKFSKCLNYTGPIYYNKINNSANILVSGKWLVDDLGNNFDIFTKKTINAIFSKKIPQKFLCDFIRGYFDGDGCLTKTQNKKRLIGRAVIDFTGTHRVLTTIYNIINDTLNIETYKIYTWKNRKCSRLAYDSKNRPRIILDWLYQASTEQTRLDRKYNKYKKYIIEGIF